ncbi:LysR family transcriptional regulator [Tautonia rosea]|uniref:LysR family transcriptional regulator n=1 Tax=Tautonia rosea TaxID=2728037 RepID=UPI0014744A63|nr:LysR family transcriptional regulator [Tautonia rosea]
MELRQLRHVLTLVEVGNYHRAAERLDLTQPALSKSIQQLERELGVSLFDRHGKTVVPTVFGELVAQSAREVLQTIEGMARTVKKYVDLEDGELSLGAGAYVADVWLGSVVGRVMRRFPQLHLTLHVEHWHVLPELLRRRQIDLFVANVEHLRDQKEFRVIEFPPQEGIWVCRADHPLSTLKSPERSVLKDYPLIGPPIPPSIRHWLDSGSSRHERPHRKIDTTSVTMIKAMIREGDAISLVHPDMVRSELAHGDFVILHFNAPRLAFHAGMAWLADRSLSPAALAFARELLIEAGLDPDASLEGLSPEGSHQRNPSGSVPSPCSPSPSQ